MSVWWGRCGRAGSIDPDSAPEEPTHGQQWTVAARRRGKLRQQGPWTARTRTWATPTPHVPHPPTCPSRSPSPRNTLESLLKQQLREASDQRKDLERQHAEALGQLREKRDDLSRLARLTQPDKKKSGETIETLQSKVRELDKKTELQNVRHEELMLEMAALRRSQQAAQLRALSRQSSLPQSPPDSPFCSSPDSAMSRETTTALSTPVPPSAHDPAADVHFWHTRGGHSSFEGKHDAPLLHDQHHFRSWQGASQSLPRPATAAAHHHASPLHNARPGRKRLRRSNSVTDLQQPSQRRNYFAAKGEPTQEIDRIVAKIQQDNKMLAELEKHAVGGTESGRPRAEAGAGRRRTLPKKPPSGKPRFQIPKIRVEAETSGKTSRELSYEQGVLPPVPQPSHHAHHRQQHCPQFATVLPTNFFLPAGTAFVTGTGGGFPQSAQQQLVLHSQQQTNHAGFLQHNLAIPTIITTTHHEQAKAHGESGQLLNGSQVLVGKGVAESKGVDVLEVPGKGRCFVYIARYSYDPFHQSPNENPEAELFLAAGDYVLIWGQVDEDGFLEGELLNGRRGLVPSNYVERLVGEDLVEFHQQVVLGLKDPLDDPFSTYAELDAPQDEAQRLVLGARGKGTARRSLPPLHQEDPRVQRLLQEELMNRRQEAEYGYLELEDMLDEEHEGVESFFSVLVPPPLQLTLERQLNKSILIAWAPPEAPPGTVDSYQVYVNGLLRCTVKANERTRALVEGVDSSRPHRISVRAVTPNRRTSRDAACTMVIGKEAPLAPSCVRATNVTSTSAVVSWLPSNSNYQHVVSVNNVEVRSVKPGVYRHAITVLTPNTTYRVTVRSKNVRAPHFDEKNGKQMERLSSHCEFRTLPKGLPDPPLDVQVEAGPQDNTLLVTWHPVSAGTSNGAVVTGYAVFADGRKILEIDSPSGDHALLDLNRFQGIIPKQVTVRTKSRDSLSSDSVPIAIPAQVLKGRRPPRTGPHHPYPPQPGSFAPLSRGHSQQNNYRRRLGPRGGQGSSLEGDESFSDRDSFQHGHGFALEPERDERGMRGSGRGGHHFPDRPMTARGYRIPPPPHRQQRPQEDFGRLDYAQQQVATRGGRGARPSGRMPSEVRQRLFVALFDYDPPSMSPNPDACDEELPFREGQMIKIYGEKDTDGFYWGEASGHRGYVPCNMVSEVHPDDERAAQEQHAQESGESQTAVVSGRERRAMGRDRWGDIYANMPMKKMVALYDYDPQELSPNVDSEVELSFRTGELIYVYGDMDDDGFYMGELNSVRGLVPSNFLTEAPADYERRRGPPHLGPPGGGPPPPQQELRRGPGLRGPPPPPRDPGGGRRGQPLEGMMMEGRRKGDASYPPPHAAHQPRTPFDGAAAGRRGGRGPQPQQPLHFQQPHLQQQPFDSGARPARSLRGPSVVPHFSPTADGPALGGQMDHPLDAHPGGGGLRGVGNLLGGPSRMMSAAGGGLVGGVTSRLPGVFGGGEGAPSNFMQKISELTHSATGQGGHGGPTPEPAGGVDSLLSKGKELIFKKFGLGE